MPSLYAIEIEYPDDNNTGWITKDKQVRFRTPDFFDCIHDEYLFGVYGDIINHAKSSPEFQPGPVPIDMSRIISAVAGTTRTYIATFYRYDIETLAAPKVTVIHKYRVQITVDRAWCKWEVTDLSLPAGRKIN